MNQFTAHDPMNDFAIIILRILMVFMAMMVVTGGFMIYQASLGLMDNWDLSIETDFINFFPAIGNSYWLMLFFSVPTLGSMIGFFLFAWLEKRIRIEV